MRVRGLTLWRPWPWSILTGTKRCENRPRRWAIEGYLLAIHAGQRWDAAGAFSIRALCPAVAMRKAAHASGCIEGAARVHEVVSSAEAQKRGIPWASDAGWCYLLEGVVRFPTPITGIQGRQGLFKLDPSVEELVVSRWGEGRVR